MSLSSVSMPKASEGGKSVTRVRKGVSNGMRTTGSSEVLQMKICMVICQLLSRSPQTGVSKDREQCERPFSAHTREMKVTVLAAISLSRW